VKRGVSVSLGDAHQNRFPSVLLQPRISLRVFRIEHLRAELNQRKNPTSNLTLLPSLGKSGTCERRTGRCRPELCQTSYCPSITYRRAGSRQILRLENSRLSDAAVMGRQRGRRAPRPTPSQESEPCACRSSAGSGLSAGGFVPTGIWYYRHVLKRTLWAADIANRNCVRWAQEPATSAGVYRVTPRSIPTP
jgi:hypothetical protein